jgi:signal transduction histidine kinase
MGSGKKNLPGKQRGRRRMIRRHNSVVIDNAGNPTGTLSSGEDVTEARCAEEAIKRLRAELAIRDSINTVFQTVADEKMYGAVLSIILEATDSPLGVFGYIDENGALVVPSMTWPVCDKCRIVDKRFVFPMETRGAGTWPPCIQGKKPILRNAPSQNLPPGHIPIQRHISLPIIHQEEVIGLIQVANKETHYGDEDLRLLETIAASVAPVLGARLERDRKTKERERAEAKLAEMVKDLQRSNRDLEQFANIVSHDLQEPLRMVASYTDLLARRYHGQLDTDADDFIGFASEGAKRMQRLILDLLAYSRITTRARPFRPVECGALLKQVLLNLKVAIEESGGVVTHDELPVIIVDEVQIGQLFQNLIANALKFHGTRTPKVHISASDDGTAWRFTVRDNGIGIDPEHKDRVFGIFQRLQTSRWVQGTGIGLAVCARVVERHGGSIWLDPEVSEGATFHFTIPKREVPERSLADTASRDALKSAGRPEGARSV